MAQLCKARFGFIVIGNDIAWRLEHQFNCPAILLCGAFAPPSSLAFGVANAPSSSHGFASFMHIPSYGSGNRLGLSFGR